MRILVANTFDHDDANPDFVQLVSIENIHRAERLKTSDVLRHSSSASWASSPAFLNGALRQMLQTQGRSGGPAPDDQRRVLLSGFQPAHIRRSVNSDLMADDLKTRHRDMIADIILAYLKS